MTEASDTATKPDVGYVTSPKNAAIKRWSKNGNVEVLAKKKVNFLSDIGDDNRYTYSK